MIRLELKNLSKRYGSHTVIRDLSGVYTTDVLGIAGSNGAGKSTLLQSIAGLLKPTLGSVEWQRSNQTIDAEALRENLGFAAPYVQLYEELTVLENLTFLKDLHPPNSTADPDELIRQFQADPFRDDLYGELSTGQQQRVKFAAASINQPEILCLDEPGSNLDTSGLELIRQWLDQIKDKNGMVILASNQQDELDLCSEIIQL